jgi:hypothetical protein
MRPAAGRFNPLHGALDPQSAAHDDELLLAGRTLQWKLRMVLVLVHHESAEARIRGRDLLFKLRACKIFLGKA